MIERIINATAPIRICDNGGWTDTHFAKVGDILNIAVNPLIRVQIRQTSQKGEAPECIINPENYGQRYHMNLTEYGAHPLLEAAIIDVGIPPGFDLEFTIYSEVKPGISTGTSAAVSVALLGALYYLNGRNVNPLEIAHNAHDIETEKLGLQSGIQDQLASANGGINYIHMNQYPDDYVVTPIRLKNSVWRGLENRLCLISLGKPHSSSDVHKQVISRLNSGEHDAHSLLEPLRQSAIKGKDALIRGDLAAFGQSVTENNEAQRRLDPRLISPQADSIMSIASKYGSLGSKVNGAGGDGGSVTIITGSEMYKGHKMINEILKSDPSLEYIPVTINHDGLYVWEEPFI